MTAFHLPLFGKGAVPSSWDNESLISEERFSIERLEQHAESLALAQPVSNSAPRTPSLVNRLKQNGAILSSAYYTIAMAVRADKPMTPAAEWLLDNYHVVEEQIHEIYDDLPPSYYRQLPKLADGPFMGYPRVFGLVWAYVAHTDSLFEPETLSRFIRAYQHVQPLAIGELWAIAITLRIILVENLRRAAVLILRSRTDREKADQLADSILSLSDAPPSVDQLFKAYRHTPLPTAFAVQLVQRLREQDPALMPALAWLNEQFVQQGISADQVVRDEHQQQGAANVTVRNIITSMRLISNLDWADFFESVSLVDELLQDSSDFALMDFPTRNLYRSAIEDLSRGSGLTELEVVYEALVKADIKQDPGYYFIGEGRPEFEQGIGFRPTVSKRFRRLISSSGISAYIVLVLLTSALVLSLPLIVLAGSSAIGNVWLAILTALGIIPATDAAVALINRLTTESFNATSLPGLELKNGIPDHLRTLLAVPTMLTSPQSIEEQISQLEIHYLAGPENNLYFALLSDWADAGVEHMDTDGPLLAIAKAGIDRLNDAYGQVNASNRFLLLHRRRCWNEQQQQWMGWERKRGKLHELNQWLRGSLDTTFISPDNSLVTSAPMGIRYVITLDGDTKLPLEATRRLIGKMAHPLNQPRFDATLGRVISGYGVLQPRVTASLPMSHDGSLFQQIFSRSGGLDPYAAVVSDVYQDLFAEGSYAGKGIYDIDAFEKTLNHRVPENTLLSHDLFEGIFARAGLVSDIEVIEEFPARYDVHAARQHRWARGDWQLLPWILGEAPLPAMGLWKMLDNLRRTLSAPASTVALLAGWLLPLDAALAWTGFILMVIALPSLLPVLSGMTPRHERINISSHWRSLVSDIGSALCQTILLTTFLAHQAWLMADAIIRTLYRLFISHHNLLEWVTAAQSKANSHLTLHGFYRQMAGSLIIAVASLVMGSLVDEDHGLLVLPFVVLWILAPAIARRVSLSPDIVNAVVLPAEATQFLRHAARRTWHFFETFVTETDHMLPPDNFQEMPHPVVAHRTSPTNIGLYLLSAVTARDFGWAGTLETVERLEATLKTMSQLQRFNGHFYNWYDTRDLRPLDPPYISSVDSGNLAGHLITLANACKEWAAACVTLGDASSLTPSPEVFRGIKDTIMLSDSLLQRLPNNRRTQTTTALELNNVMDALVLSLQQGQTAPSLQKQLEHLLPSTRNMVDIARTFASERGDDASTAMRHWAEITLRAIEQHLGDVTQTPASIRLLKQRLLKLESQARAMANDMAFGF